MTNRINHFLTTFTLAGLAVFLGVLQSLVWPSSASAVVGAGRGVGYLSADGWWLGSYRLDDGALGFCLDAGKPSPTGHELDYHDGAALGRFAPEQLATLAYISRSWAGTDDRLTAGAGQLATWLIAGLGGRTPHEVAARAGADAAAVLARAEQMVDEAHRLGSSGVRADAVVELAETGPGRVRVELTAERLRGPDQLAPGAHAARATLDGATFADGTATADIPSGTDVAIHPTGDTSSVSVAVEAAFGELPYGDRITVAVARSEAQSVLIAIPATAEARSEASISGPSPLPFQPRVETVTSAAVAAPGASLSDRLTVSVETTPGLLPVWGVRASGEGLVPIEAVVESTLVGPFDEPITEAEEAPDGAPITCTVETVVSGTGDYETPACTLPAAGYYVWTERIDPSSTPAAHGGERLLPWQSAFGVASEVTLAEPVLAPAAAPAKPELAATGAALPLFPAGVAAASVLGGSSLLLAARRRTRRPSWRPLGRRATHRAPSDGRRRP